VIPTGCQNKGNCLSWFIRYIYRNLKNPGLIQTDILYRCKILDVALTGYF
jgi:hypothetical protein